RALRGRRRRVLHAPARAPARAAPRAPVARAPRDHAVLGLRHLARVHPHASPRRRRRGARRQPRPARTAARRARGGRRRPAPRARRLARAPARPRRARVSPAGSALVGLLVAVGAVVVLPLGLRLLGARVVPAPRSAAWPLAGACAV